MRQLSLFDSINDLAGLIPAIRAAMRRAAGDPESEGRKALVDKINALAKDAGVTITGGNAKSISKDTLDKWLSPSDISHIPSINALMVFCQATGDLTPISLILKTFGLSVMTDEDRKFRDLGKASVELKRARKRIKRLEEEIWVTALSAG